MSYYPCYWTLPSKLLSAGVAAAVFGFITLANLQVVLAGPFRRHRISMSIAVRPPRHDCRSATCRLASAILAGVTLIRLRVR